MPEHPKPFLGGLKHKDTGHIHLHGFAQTDQPRQLKAPKQERGTQTFKMNTKSHVTYKEFGTQTERPGLWIDTRGDKVVKAGPYFTSEMWALQREAAAHFIQKMMRGCFARKRTRALREEKEKKKREQIRREKLYREEEERKHEKEIRRRINPKSKEDFDILYQELELWRAGEME